MYCFKISAVFALLFLQTLCALPALSVGQVNWLKLDYSNLVDKNVRLRTGQNLGSALGSPGLRGALQPYLDRYSYLLEYAVELVTNENSAFTNIVDKYPIGQEQPAWVVLFRSGKMSAYTDNNRTVRLFLNGQNPQTAYLENYSVIRHLLNSLKPSWGKLQVEIYAFQNDYRTLSLRLNSTPAYLSGSGFGTPAGKIPLDLSGLSDFFRQEGQLEGAQINERSGLQLYAKAGPAQSLAGNAIQLSDLAVAYRAVFHAGDNKAFISLDPNKDVTKASVNFGGYLEDTALGKVVLESDKRFKTLTSGLDPNSYKDMRGYTRQYVPNFLSVNERDLLTVSAKKGWVKTRFWFYPDSIEVQTDTTKHLARIINPHFLADAERSRDDFNSSAEFEKKKKALLLPSIRQNIDDLNQNYDQYAQAFTEFRELVTVGRLMAICSWLSRVNPQWLDLDALLAVKLPAERTERERTQLIASATLSPGNYEKNTDNVKKNLIINYLSPDLDMLIRAYFSDERDLAEFLKLKAGLNYDVSKYFSEAATVLKNQGNNTVRSLLKSQPDIQAFAIFAGHRKQPAGKSQDELNEIKAEEKFLVEENRELAAAQKSLQEYRTLMTNDQAFARTNLTNFNARVASLNNQVKAYQARAENLNKRVIVFNQSQQNISPQIVEIGGGINLEAENFKIKTVAGSPQLNDLKNITSKARPEWTAVSKQEKWITNKVSIIKPETQKSTNFTQPAIENKLVKRFTALFNKTTPQDKFNKSLGKITSNKQKEIIVRTADQSIPKIKGEMVNAQTIVFKRM